MKVAIKKVLIRNFKKFLERPRYSNLLLNNKKLSILFRNKKFLNFLLYFFIKKNNLLIKKYLIFDKNFLFSLKNLKKFKNFFLKPLFKA